MVIPCDVKVENDEKNCHAVVSLTTAKTDQRMGLKTAKHNTTWMIMGHWFAANNELLFIEHFFSKAREVFHSTVDRDSMKRGKH